LSWQEPGGGEILPGKQNSRGTVALERGLGGVPLLLPNPLEHRDLKLINV